MKMLTFFLSLSILFLSCITCADLPENFVQKSGSLTASAIKKNTDHVAEDNCSPLCTCNCCNQPVVDMLNNTTLDVPKIYASAKNQVNYTSQTASDFSGAIWQPPKLNPNTAA